MPFLLRPSRHRHAFVVLFLLLTCARTARVEAQPAPAPATIDAKADEILRRMSKTLADAKALSFEADESNDQVLDNGQQVQLSRHVSVALRRPDRLAATVRGDMSEMTYTYDGKTLTILNQRDHLHAMQEVPNTLDATFDFLAERFGITPPLADVMFSDPYQALIGQVRSGRYLGLHEIAGVKCHHLAFRQDVIDWQVWVEDGAQAVPRKIVMIYKEQPGYPRFVAVLDKWNLAANPPATAFDAKVPADSKRVDLQPLAPATQPAAASGGGK